MLVSVMYCSCFDFRQMLGQNDVTIYWSNMFCYLSQLILVESIRRCANWAPRTMLASLEIKLVIIWCHSWVMDVTSRIAVYRVRSVHMFIQLNLYIDDCCLNVFHATFNLGLIDSVKFQAIYNIVKWLGRCERRSITGNQFNSKLPVLGNEIIKWFLGVIS